MSRQIINNTPADSGLGDTLKVAFDKVNAMTLELYNADASFSDIVTEIDTTLDSLQTQINGKAPIVHTHVISQINGLQAALNGKVSTSTYITDMMAINSSIQAINDALNEITDILTQLEQDKVPYTGATRDVDLGYNAFRNNNGLLVSWENGNAKFGWENIDDSKQIYFADSATNNAFIYSGLSIDFICNLEEGWGTSNWGYDYNDGTYLGSTIYNSVNGAGLNTQMGNNNISQVRTSAGEVALTNLNNGSGPLMESSLKLWKNYTQLLITNNDTTEANTIEMYTDRTYTKKYITTDEGYVGDYLQLNTAATEASAVGKLKWNDTDGTVDIGLKGGNVTLQIGQENVARVVNKTSPLIDLLEANYQVVKIVGATGQRLSVALAQADNDLNSATTLGVVTETILRNQEGFITTNGQVKEINTTGSLQGESWNDGDVLYLSPTTAGKLTNVKPVAPQHTVIVGYVEYAHSQHGKIFVKVDNGYELDELHNVKISAATSGDVLTYNSTSQVWENKTLNEITGTYNVKITTPSSIVSGTTSEVQILKLEIPPYSFGPNDVLNIPNLIISKVGTIASYTLRVKISTSSTMPIGTGTDTIAFMSIGNTNTLTKMYRNYFISGGFLRGIGTINSASDVVNSTTALFVKAFDHTITNYLYVSVNPASAADTFQLVGLQINNL